MPGHRPKLYCYSCSGMKTLWGIRMERAPTLLESLRRAVDAMPDDVALRVHLATLLLEAGRRDEGIREVGAILQRDPANSAAMALITGGSAADPERGQGSGTGAAGLTATSTPPESDQAGPGRPGLPEGDSGLAAGDPGPTAADAGPGHPGSPAGGLARADLSPLVTPDPAIPVHRPAPGTGGSGSAPGEAPPAAPDFDWRAAESELADVLPPRFVGSTAPPRTPAAIRPRTSRLPSMSRTPRCDCPTSPACKT